MAVSTMQDDKKKALNLAIAQIEKNCGKGSIMRLGAGTQRARVGHVSNALTQRLRFPESLSPSKRCSSFFIALSTFSLLG